MPGQQNLIMRASSHYNNSSHFVGCQYSVFEEFWKTYIQYNISSGLIHAQLFYQKVHNV